MEISDIKIGDKVRVQYTNSIGEPCGIPEIGIVKSFIISSNTHSVEVSLNGVSNFFHSDQLELIDRPNTYLSDQETLTKIYEVTQKISTCTFENAKLLIEISNILDNSLIKKRKQLKEQIEKLQQELNLLQ